ncbi:MAG: hypothetical protein HY815_22360, partial [Candidatus Riflebacteria bacterium]|nr:hypothetical protein [Candidatus Riflebacteria bacterium]
REITLDDYVRDVARYNRAYNHWIGWAGYWSHYHPDCASAFVEAGPTWTALYDTYLSMASKPTWLVTDWSWLDQSVNIDASINVGISEAEVARYEAYLENLPDAPIDASLTDTDKDGIPDVRDPDIDNDGIPNGRDPDANNNGIPNAQEIDLGGGAQSDEE